VAVLFAQERAIDAVTHAHPGHTGTALGWTYPGFDVGKEDAAMLERLAEQGTVTVELSSAATLGGAVNDSNVVGEIKGRDLPNEWIVICAHLDAWDYGTGSQDNGAGVAEVLEVARAIKASGYVPRRSVRFVLWGGEEEGLIGSRAYVKAHEAELSQIVAVLNTDNGAGALKGWHTEGRDDLEKALKEFSKTRLAGLGADKFDDETSCDTDHCPFMLAGVPSLNLWVDMEAQYFKVHHAPSDTFDKVDAAQLSNAAAVVALTAIEIAERDAPLAPHVGRDKVTAIVKKADMLDDLVEWGMWTK
jgi:Zn-dependent M28 family amino/carboxypeptidase